ncbi:hypothetical protein BCR35DRAFT_297914 [Leucosporidium creatinivorum]|uniref:PQ loop repeat-domain-containing protein n=1 Tax=Leucosporidium creatinivorum TaxID=106004 RepID=A0A1Y2G3H7_9BASI|nr:hypothetical protein BCR35DRAFT_297914 [Leucosporidium creatinivorum]
MGFIQTVAAIGMAVGPPLAYADQYVSVVRKHDSRGFSTDVCGVLIVANVTRCVYWLGARFEIALLVQSVLMILGQFALLYVCLLYRTKGPDGIDPRSLQETEGLTTSGGGGYSKEPTKSSRPGNLWQWDSFGTYIEFVAMLVALHCGMFLLLHGFETYVTILGFLALGLEATLPIPQLLVNFERKSTAGFRHSVLAGWVGGDAIKTIYFFATDGNSIAFKACAIFQLSVDVALCFQTWAYREQTKRDLDERAGLREQEGVAGAESLLRAARHEEEP